MSDAPYERNVSSRFGAPMGRRSDLDVTTSAKLHLRRVPMVDGDYDPGGAYWGLVRERPLWCAWDENGSAHYFRSTYDRDTARATFPNARFYR